jgi:hypothetical protein
MLPPPPCDPPPPQLFFARAPHSATENDIRSLFAAFGRVEAVKCFRAGQAAPGAATVAAAGAGPSSKGCGLVKMATAREAEAAIAALHETSTWGGMPAPMVRRGRGPRAAGRERAREGGRGRVLLLYPGAPPAAPGDQSSPTRQQPPEHHP